MINLLPRSYVKQLRAAQQNTFLLRYIIATTATLFLVFAINIASFILLKNTEQASIASAEESQTQINRYGHIRQATEEYANNLKIAKNIFDSNISYSGAAMNIARNLPAGVLLQTITLDRSTIGKPTTLVAKIRSYADGVALKDKLQNSTIAKDVSISSTTDDRSAGNESSIDSYPFTVTLNLTYTEDVLKPIGEIE